MISTNQDDVLCARPYLKGQGDKQAD